MQTFTIRQSLQTGMPMPVPESASFPLFLSVRL